MNIQSNIQCNECSKEFSSEDLIRRISDYWKGVDAFISSTPCCNNKEEIQISESTISRGYVYAAGSPHFCRMEDYCFSDIEVHENDDFFIFEFSDKTLKISK